MSSNLCRYLSPFFLWVLMEFVFLNSPALAMDPFEIQVYGNDIKKPAEWGVEIHTNYIPRGFTTPSVPNGPVDHHLWHLTFEFSRGILENFDVGLYYQSAFQNDQGYYGGTKLRAKYLRQFSEQGFAGVNVEVGRQPKEFDPDEWGSEIRPIIGYNGDLWFVAFNPILELTLGQGKRTPGFEPQIKIGRQISQELLLGIEYYAELGPINNIPKISEQTHNLFLTLDKEFKSAELNFGIGRGMTSTANDWTIKMIIGKDL